MSVPLGVLFWEGFEHGSITALATAGFTFSGAAGSITTAAGQVHKSSTGAGGSRAYNINYQATMKTPTFATTARWCYFWKRENGVPSSQQVQFSLTGTIQVYLQLNANGTITLHRGGNNAQLAASADVGTSLASGAWISCEYVAHGTTGLFNLYFGASTAPVLTFSGNTLVNGGSATGWDRVHFYGGDNASSWVDDIVVTDGSGVRVPEAYIVLLTPTGAGVTAGGFTPTGAASNAAATDDVPVQETVFAGSSTPADEITLAMANLPSTLSLVPDTPVKVSAYGSRDGTITGIDLRIRDGGTDAYRVGATIPASGTFKLVCGYFAVDNAGAAWTTTSVNAVEAGVRLT